MCGVFTPRVCYVTRFGSSNGDTGDRLPASARHAWQGRVPTRRLAHLARITLPQIVNNETGSVLQTINGDTEPVTSLVWGPRMESVIVASRSLQVRSFSVETGKVLKHFRGHRAPVAHMAVDGSETLLATASADKMVKVWDIEGGYCTHSFSGHRCVDVSERHREGILCGFS